MLCIAWTLEKRFRFTKAKSIQKQIPELTMPFCGSDTRLRISMNDARTCSILGRFHLRTKNTLFLWGLYVMQKTTPCFILFSGSVLKTVPLSLGALVSLLLTPVTLQSQTCR